MDLIWSLVSFENTINIIEEELKGAFMHMPVSKTHIAF